MNEFNFASFNDFLNVVQNKDIIIIILIFFVFILLIVNLFYKRKINKRFNDIPGVRINDKIFSEIKKINENLGELNMHKVRAEAFLKEVDNRFKKMKIIKYKKYNPYADMGVGGQQSFSVSILDFEGNGIILTSLYSRDRTRVLLREVEYFNPKQELTLEEKEVLEEAKKEAVR